MTSTNAKTIRIVNSGSKDIFKSEIRISSSDSDITILEDLNKMIKYILLPKGTKKETWNILDVIFRIQKVLYDDDHAKPFKMKDIDNIHTQYEDLLKLMKFIEFDIDYNNFINRCSRLNDLDHLLLLIFIELVIDIEKNKYEDKFEKAFNYILSRPKHKKKDLVPLLKLFKRDIKINGVMTRLPCPRSKDLVYNYIFNSNKYTIYDNKHNRFVMRFKKFVGREWKWITDGYNKDSRSFNFPKGLTVACNALYSCLSERDLKEVSDSEDVDFWVYGKNDEERKENLNNAIKFLSKGMDKIVYSVNRSVITLIGRGKNTRNLQIICTDKKKPEQITDSFDLEYLKCYYDGDKVYATKDTINALDKNFITIKDFDKINIERIFKILRYKLSVKENEESQNINEYLATKLFPRNKQLQTKYSDKDLLIKYMRKKYDIIRYNESKFIRLPKTYTDYMCEIMVNKLLGKSDVYHDIDILIEKYVYLAMTNIKKGYGYNNKIDNVNLDDLDKNELIELKNKITKLLNNDSDDSKNDVSYFPNCELDSESYDCDSDSESCDCDSDSDN